MEPASFARDVQALAFDHKVVGQILTLDDATLASWFTGDPQGLTDTKATILDLRQRLAYHAALCDAAMGRLDAIGPMPA